MPTSIWAIEIGLADGSDAGAERAERIIEHLSQQQTVQGERPVWKALFHDVEREHAVESLHRELTEIDPDWSEVSLVE